MTNAEPRVLHVTAVRIGGGTPIYVQQLAEAALAAGADHHIACPPHSQLYKRLSSSPVPFHPLRFSGRGPVPIVQAAWDLRSIVRGLRPDVVHLHSSIAGAIGRVAVQRAPTVIFQPHAWSFLGLDGLPRRGAIQLEKLLRRRHDLLVCGSEDEAATGLHHGLGPNIEVHTNAVDTNAFVPLEDTARQQQREALLNQLGEGHPDELIVVVVGRIAPQKDPHLLMDVWDRVHQTLTPARLVMVGDGPMREEIEARAPASVSFVGEIDDVLPWHQIADLSVVPSRYETFSLSMLEALAAGSPVLSTRVGGAETALVAGDLAPAGAVVDIGDGPALAEQLVLLAKTCREPAKRDAARQRALRHDTTPWAKRWLELYRDAVNL